ncbi:PCNA-interacting partner [Lepisosteus oculatus]|uniref:PCNA-interacting partner n=1 Tax=Lepisosteus oculatus TaxID=7918 RepID=UPI0037168ED5
MAILQQNLKVLVKAFRRDCYRLLGSERITICNADDMFTALQLVMAEVNKQEKGEFAVSLSEVIVTWAYLLKDKLNLFHEGSHAPENYNIIRKSYDSFLKRSNTVDLIDIFGMAEQLKIESDPENRLAAVQLFEFLSGNSEYCDQIDLVPPVPSTPSSRPRWTSSQLLKVMKRLICAYLNLLLNSKNDLAVAHVLNIPDRGLGRAAFTDLKHAARDKQTSLFLAATSFVRAIQLGGKSYAPSETDPLRKHLKGLSSFVHFMDNLEELLGEIPDPCLAGGRILSAIEAGLLRGGSSGDLVGRAAREALQELQRRIGAGPRGEATDAGAAGISPARPRAYAINHATAYSGRDTVKVLLALLDEDALRAPSRNKAQLFLGDEGVLGGDEGACVLQLFRSPEPSTGSSPKPLRHRVRDRGNKTQPQVMGNAIKSQFACTYRDSDPDRDRTLLVRSLDLGPSCIHPAARQASPPGGSCDKRPAAAHEGVTESTESENLIKRPAFGSTSGNTQQKGNLSNKGRGIANTQPGNKSCKRKGLDAPRENGPCSQENQPPPKRAPEAPKTPDKPSRNPGGRARAPGRTSKAAAKRKLIAGQGKLTNFFRL